MRELALLIKLGAPLVYPQEQGAIRMIVLLSRSLMEIIELTIMNMYST